MRPVSRTLLPCPAFVSSFETTHETYTWDHWPPRAVRMPRSFTANDTDDGNEGAGHGWSSPASSAGTSANLNGRCQ